MVEMYDNKIVKILELVRDLDEEVVLPSGHNVFDEIINNNQVSKPYKQLGLIYLLLENVLTDYIYDTISRVSEPEEKDSKYYSSIIKTIDPITIPKNLLGVLFTGNELLKQSEDFLTKHSYILKKNHKAILYKDKEFYYQEDLSLANMNNFLEDDFIIVERICSKPLNYLELVELLLTDIDIVNNNVYIYKDKVDALGKIYRESTKIGVKELLDLSINELKNQKMLQTIKY